jgi:hypothetical protein
MMNQYYFTLIAGSVGTFAVMKCWLFLGFFFMLLFALGGACFVI